MKITYKRLLIAIGIVLAVNPLLAAWDVFVRSAVLMSLYGLLFFALLLMLFFRLSRDESIGPRVRTVCKVAFWFLCYCVASFLIGPIGILIAKTADLFATL